MSSYWYPWHYKDYAQDTSDLSMLEDSAYRRLLDFIYANRANAPANASRLHRICRATTQEEQDAVDHVVQRFFYVEEGGLRNKRADLEIEKIKQISMKRSKSAQIRHEKDANAPANAPANEMQLHTQSQSQSHRRKNTPRRPPKGGDAQEALRWFDGFVAGQENGTAAALAGMRDLYTDWAKYRVAIRRPLTELTVKLEVGRLAKLVKAGGEEQAREWMHDAIANGYIGWWFPDQVERWKAEGSSGGGEKSAPRRGGFDSGDEYQDLQRAVAAAQAKKAQENDRLHGREGSEAE